MPEALRTRLYGSKLFACSYDIVQINNLSRRSKARQTSLQFIMWARLVIFRCG